MSATQSNRENRIRNDVLKLLYATMLVELSAGQVKEFWQRRPLKDGSTVLKDAELLRHIWDESKHVDLAYMMSVLNAVEPFLVSQGIPTLRFVDKLIAGLNKGAMIGVGPILGAMAPFLRFLFSSKDVLHFATKNVLPHILRKIVPSLRCQMVKHEARAGRATSVLLLNFNASSKKVLPPYDPYLFFARPLQLGPTRIGMAPLEEVRLLSDARTLDMIIEKGLLTFDRNEVRIKGRHAGSVVGFYEHCRRHGISLQGLDVPDKRVVEILESYVCPVRNREVLSRGCVYGAPICLVGFTYKVKPQPTEHFLTPIIHESLSGKNEEWQLACERHAGLVRELERRIVFVFHRSDETVSVDGRRLVKSAPALILADIVRKHVSTGKVDFTNRDFTCNGNGSAGIVPENFSLRLQRLSAILSEKFPEVGIVKTGRGQFRFRAPCRVELEEA